MEMYSSMLTIKKDIITGLDPMKPMAKGKLYITHARILG